MLPLCVQRRDVPSSREGLSTSPSIPWHLAPSCTSAPCVCVYVCACVCSHFCKVFTQYLFRETVCREAVLDVFVDARWISAYLKCSKTNLFFFFSLVLQVKHFSSCTAEEQTENEDRETLAGRHKYGHPPAHSMERALSAVYFLPQHLILKALYTSSIYISFALRWQVAILLWTRTHHITL